MNPLKFEFLYKGLIFLLFSNVTELAREAKN